MRYSVFFKKPGGEKTCVYNTMSPDLTLALMNPKVHLAVDSAGTFECALNPNSPGIPDTVLERMATKVMVVEHKDINNLQNKIIFYGRVLSIEEDFYNTPSLYCEGAFSFFNDTVIMPGKNLSRRWDPDEQSYKYRTPKEALIEVIAEHNAAVTKGSRDQGLRFSVNPDDIVVTMKDDIFSAKAKDGSDKPIDDFTVDTYTSTIEVLNNLKKTFGGHFRIHYTESSNPDTQMALPVLDWIADMDETKEGTNSDPKSYISFGQNLLDFTKKRDGANIVNAVFLTGKKINSKDATVIGDEIDILPMCIYYKLDKNGNPWRPTTVPGTYETWDSLHDPLHDPTSINELWVGGTVGGTPKDINVSHTYIIGNEWYAWNPLANSGNGDYVALKSARQPATDDDLKNGDVVRLPDGKPFQLDMTDPAHPIFNEWEIDSKGLAPAAGGTISNPIHGKRLVRDSDTVVAWEDETSYISTGFWVSIDAGVELQPSIREKYSLPVFTGEKYYLRATAWASSIMQTITTGHLRNGNATLISTSLASSSGTKYNYSTITIPEVTKDDLKNLQMHLYISGRHSHNVDGDYDTPTRDLMELNLYKSRVAPYDEYVTLWGLAGGDHQNFLTSVETTTSNGQKTSQTVLIRSKAVTQNRMGAYPYKFLMLASEPSDWSTNWKRYYTKDGDIYVKNSQDSAPTFQTSTYYEIRGDKYFVYPEPGTGKTVEYYQNEDEIDTATKSADVYYVALDTCDVYTWNGTDIVKASDHRAYAVNSYMVEDTEAIEKYGRIEKIVNFSACTDPESLKLLGAKALFEAKLEAFEINVTALDLSLIDSNVESPDILDPIKIYSKPHKVDATLPLSERDIPLNDPVNQQYTIGYQGTQTISKTYSWIRK